MLPEERDAVAVILGSAFGEAHLKGFELERMDIETPFGTHVLHRAHPEAHEPGEDDPEILVSFRHGVPHTLLPNQIDYRAQAWALGAMGCGALVVTSSVGVMDASIPLHAPLLVSDVLMLDNRLPTGEACTMFPEPLPGQGHLVLEEGLCSTALGEQIREVAHALETPVVEDVVFAYVGGPRTKTAAENRMLAAMGAQVNSMTLAPEIVLANELEIPCVGLVMGHKYSLPDHETPDAQGVAASLEASRDAFSRLVRACLHRARPVGFANHIYRFES